MILKPHVRYALRGLEDLKFGSVKGVFTINEQVSTKSYYFFILECTVMLFI